MNMVTRDEVLKYRGRGGAPFAPYRVVLKDGKTVTVNRRLQATANNRVMVIGADSPIERTRWILLADIERLEPAQPQQH